MTVQQDYLGGILTAADAYELWDTSVEVMRCM